jgi:hypothetical protein
MPRAMNNEQRYYRREAIYDRHASRVRDLNRLRRFVNGLYPDLPHYEPRSIYSRTFGQLLSQIFWGDRDEIVAHCNNNLSEVTRALRLRLATEHDLCSCYGCHGLVADDDSIEQDGNIYCEPCFDDNFAVCDGCGEIFANDDLRDGYCESCRVQCHNCECTESQEDSEGEYIGDFYYCSSCRDELFIYDEDEEDYISRREYNARQSVLSYGSANDLCRRVGENYMTTQLVTLPLIGWELEFCTGDSDVKAQDKWEQIRRAIGDVSEYIACCERDSSTVNDDTDGAEIVSHWGPLPLLSDAITETCRAMRKARVYSHDTTQFGVSCGLHVNVGRAGIDTPSIARLVVFLNEPRNRDFLKHWAKRWESGYSVPKPEKGDKAKLADPDSLVFNEDRYELINLQNRSRAEFRLYKGTTRGTRAVACLELSFWLTVYCQLATADELDYSSFVEWSKSEVVRFQYEGKEYSARCVADYWAQRNIKATCC